MALQVLYRNKLRAGILLVVAFLTAAYVIVESKKTIPATRINATDVHLSRENGMLYYNNEAFSGWLYTKYDDGAREREIPYYEGKEEGVLKSWYQDGAIAQERLFVEGKKEGTHRGWWPNGAPKFEYQFKNNEHNGTAKEWFNNNKLYRYFHYNNGYEEGLEQLWWPDGKVRANYVVKDGVQYGLIGRKFCKNVFKNEAL